MELHQFWIEVGKMKRSSKQGFVTQTFAGAIVKRKKETTKRFNKKEKTK